MKIGIDARMLGYSGIGRYTQALIQHLIKIDHKNHYIVFVQKRPKNKDIEKFLKYLNFLPLIKLTSVDAPIYSVKEQINFYKAVVKEKLDIIHFTHFNLPLFYNKPFLVTIHDLTPLYFPGKKRNSFLQRFAYQIVLKKALRGAKRVIAVSRFTKQDIIKHFPDIRNKIVVIYEGIEKPKRVNKIKKSPPKPYLLYVGVWREHKNLVGLIKAFNKVKSFGQEAQNWLKELKLILVGKPDPYYLEVLETARLSPFYKDIIFTGFLSDEELAFFYQNAEAFVFPSFYEGFGLPPLEAMSYQTPVISSKAGALPEILQDAALYFDPYQTDQIAEKIIQLLTNPRLKQEMIRKGLKQVKKYSWAKMAQETLRQYQIAMSCKSI